MLQIHLLHLVQNGNKILWISCSGPLKAILNCKVWNPADAILPRAGNRLINSRAILIAVHNSPFEVGFRNACGDGSIAQHLIRGNVFLILKIRGKQFADELLLHLASILLGQLNQPVRVARVADPAAKAKVDAEGRADCPEPIENPRVDGAISFLVQRQLVLAVPGSPGRVRHQLIRKEFHFERISRIRVPGLPEFDGSLQLTLADVAPGADRVRDDLDVECSHSQIPLTLRN